MSSPLVSIIIPCFNAERFIADAIRSALTQEYPNFEVIVIDDGSTDRSLEIIRSFDVRWETGPNRGGSEARNRGIRLARAELIQFLDADDLLYPQKLQRQVQALNATGADMVYCDCEFIGESASVLLHSREIGSQDPVQFILGGTLPTPAVMHYRTNLLAAGGFTSGMACAQERDLHLRLACMGLRIAHLPEVLVTARRMAGSVSSDLIKVIDQHIAIARRGYEMLKNLGTLTESRARALAGWLASDARIYLRHGLHAKAKEYFQTAREMHIDGGLSLAYEKPARVLRSVLGPALTEQLVTLKRKLVA